MNGMDSVSVSVTDLLVSEKSVFSLPNLLLVDINFLFVMYQPWFERKKRNGAPCPPSTPIVETKKIRRMEYTQIEI